MATQSPPTDFPAPAISPAITSPAITPTYLTVAEVAAILGVSTARVRRLIQTGQIPADAVRALNPRMNLVDRRVVAPLARERGRPMPS